jgi:hypothetical protein
MRKCGVESCDNVALLNCVGCGQGNCGQHGWDSCPVCKDMGKEALMPEGPGAEAHALGYEIASSVKHSDVVRLSNLLAEAQKVL